MKSRLLSLEDSHCLIACFFVQLKAAGYNYYGSEPLYSGMYGTEFYADICKQADFTSDLQVSFGTSSSSFPPPDIGLVFYQRLRHMVNDKYQVRAVGPVHNLTHQPIKVQEARRCKSKKQRSSSMKKKQNHEE